MGAIIRAGERLTSCHYALDEAQWDAMLASPPLWFVAHWCDAHRVYALFLEHERPLLASTELLDGRYLALSRNLPAAEWPERMAQDLWGVQPMFARDLQPLIDRDAWTRTAPLSPRPGPGGVAGLPAESPEPFFEVGGPLALAARHLSLGYAHRGLLRRLRGATPEEGLRQVGRISAGGFVAHPLAYCRAVEQALGARVPAAGRDGRIVLAEIERIGVHLHDIAACAQQTGARLLATHAALARERLADLAVEHGATRRLTDMLTPEGIAPDIAAPAPALALAAEAMMAERMGHLIMLHRASASHLRGVARLSLAQVERFNIGGLAARATGRSFDCRQQEDDHRYLAGRAGSLIEGDALARERLRLREIRDSLRRLRRVADGFGAEWPEGGSVAPSGEGIGAAEGPRGDIWYWVRLRAGRIDAIHVRDPAFSLAPLLPRLLDPSIDTLVLSSFGFSAAALEL
ncbi:hypothetical protein A0U93_14055 [Neoasaia chiangmaiensis]|uniref:NADH-quinone oxidoreductase subunit D domain-containing protein n=2 Tax=Neoasaia chiangmaiensis TaxID=320497 RepID=A0A1U9KT59_9PROT|nr:hypothetical protein A0U93_14055 [Neoasaia chiangmaiensis]